MSEWSKPATYPTKTGRWSTGPWHVAGVVGASNTGSVRYGVKSVGLRWYWEIGLELEPRPWTGWTDLDGRTQWVLASGYEPKVRSKKDVLGEVSAGAGFWLTILQTWAQQRYELIDIDFDFGKRRHDCGWCMGHPELDPKTTVTDGTRS